MEWEKLASINLHKYDEKIKSRKEMKKFVAKICKIIEMKKLA